MRYPAHYYVYQTVSKQNYTRHPHGTPDITRAANGYSDYWLSPGASLEKKPKALIIGPDWTAASWSDKKIVAIQTAIQELLKQGFPVYLWQAGTLKPLRDDKTLAFTGSMLLSQLMDKTIHKALATPPNEPQSILESAASEHHLSQDEIHVLDNYGINQLLCGHDNKPRSLTVLDFQPLNNNDVNSSDIEKHLNYLKHANPPLHSLVLDVFSTNRQKEIQTTLDQLHKRYPSLLLETAYRRVDLDLYSIKVLVEKKHIIMMSIPNSRLDWEQLTHIDELSISGVNCHYTPSFLIIKSVLLAAPNLEKMKLSDYKNIGEDLVLPPESLAHLKEIDLSYSNLRTQNLQAILRAAPNLEEMVLSSYQNIGEDLVLLPGSLTHLKKIYLSYSNINTQGLLALLHAAPNLNIINLPANIGEDLVLLPGSLPDLEEVNLFGSKISAQSILALLNAAQNLKKIHLSHCENIGEDLVLLPGSLPDLKEVNLFESDISTQSLQALLTAAPNLNIMNLSYYGNEDEDEDLVLLPKSLAHLDKVNLSESDISTQNLQALLNAAPNIKIMLLLACKIIGEDLVLLPGSLPDLEEVNLSESKINAQSLQALLTAAPNLKKITLSKCKNINKDLELLPGSLPDLEEVNLFESNISAQSLQALLNAAPNIKIIDLTVCKNIGKDLVLSPGSLAHLKVVKLSRSNISFQNLQSLLSAAPNLKIVHLYACKNIGENIALLPGSLTHLKQIYLSSSNINTQGLQALLTAAPNLKKIILSECENISEDLELLPGSLPDLEIIDLSESDISDQSLETLLAAAPKLNRKLLQTELSHYSHSKISAPSIKPRHQNARLVVNADTTPTPEEVLFVEHIFYPINHHQTPKPNNYRLAIYDTASIHDGPCSIANAFRYENGGDLALEACHTPISKAPFVRDAATSDECYHGNQRLRLTEEWQALASLSPEEEMLRYHTSPECDLEIKYSRRDNQYYIRLQHGSAELDIDFTLRIPRKEPKTLPAEVQTLVDDFQRFGLSALSLSAGELTGKDYLDAINTQRVGACRHRAFAFKKKMDERGISSRIITSDCHAFVEVFCEGTWFSCDLGGYPAKLKTYKRYHPHTETPAPHHPHMEQDISFDVDATLQTWEKMTDRPEEYYKSCVNGETKKHLIECATTEDSDALHYALQAHCHQLSRPMFYVHSPEDLLCMVSYMHRHVDNTGEIRRGPSGPLHAFLTNPSNANGVLLINFATFTSSDFVRFNTIMDELPSIDGIPLPKDMVMLGLLAKDAAVIPGSDFYSRADRVATCPLSHEELARAYPALPMPTGEALATRPYPIPLYHAADWISRLLGQWLPEGNVWRYQDGLLQQALASGATHIELQNGLWENEDFVRFWREAKDKGFIEYAGTRITLPKNVLITQQDGYDWAHLSTYVRAASIPTLNSYTLVNPTLLGDLFTQYETSPEKNLCRKPGVIAEASTKTPAELTLYITHTLSEDEWAMILQTCAAQTPAVTVIPYTAPGVTLPPALSTITSLTPEIPYRDEAIVIQSTDVDTTAAIWLAHHPESLVLDVSECEASDLLSYVDAKLVSKEAEPLRLEFETVTSAVSTALAKGQSVVLKGQCSTTLAQALAQLLWQRINSTPAPEGYLLIIAEDTSNFSYLTRHEHKVSPLEKVEVLGELPPKLAPYLSTEPLMKLKARLRFLQHNPTRDSNEAWQGLSTLTVKHQHIAPLLLDDTAREDEAKAFTQQRKDAVNAVFDQGAPYVYLAGLSGVGKTTFITDVFIDSSRDILYQGESALLAWATDTTADKQKYLFIDEANLSTTQLSIFEGLFNTPPGILINGHYYPLSPEHKVIFAGNPMQYQGERSLAPFFLRHGNTVVFDPLSSNVIYEDILKQIFANSPLENQSLALCQPLLAIYSYLCHHSTTDILISPRELEMIALLTLARCCDDDKDIPDTQQVAAHFAYQLTHALVPAQHKKDFERRFKPSKTLAPQSTPNSSDFLLTPSHQQAYALLDDCLSLREKRPEALHRIQRSGGLGGMVLEGSPGNGKSELVLQALRTRGYQEIPLRRTEDTYDNPRSFYRIPVSLADSEKEACLIHAFHQGAVVVIDEINSAPRMERLLNALLMGKTPEGRPAEKPGFMVIATQNPITRAGRRAASPALARRFITKVIADYSDEEKQHILQHKGLTPNEANVLVTAYNKQATFAQKHQLSPEPTFRDVLKTAKLVIKCRHDRESTELVEHITKSSVTLLTTALGLFTDHRRQCPSENMLALDERIETVAKL